MKSSRLVFFGDSICVGQGISIHKSWVSRIAARIESLTPSGDRELVVVNASISGNTTRQALERMPYDVQSHGVDFLLVQFGMNDCNYWVTDGGVPRVSPRAFAANLHEIIERGFRFGARKVFLNTNHPTARGASPMPGADLTYEESNQQYNELIRKVASDYAEPAVVLNDVGRFFLDYVGGDSKCLSDLLLADGLHLSALGHDLYYRVISPRIEEVLSDFVSQTEQDADPATRP